MMLRIEGLKKCYGKKVVLEIPEFVLERGIYWLRGPNGSGKTTLAKILAGIIPSEGSITINDHISLTEKPYQYRLTGQLWRG